jgi:DNA-directed RNA polymerase specialized sigma24 family protein
VQPASTSKIVIPDDVYDSIIQVLQKRSPLDSILFYARWYVGMNYNTLAERLDCTTESVRRRLNAIHAAVKKNYELTHKGKYTVSLEEDDEDVTQETSFAAFPSFEHVTRGSEE